MENSQAIILFSGGVDSTVALAIAISRGKKCFCLSFDYGQRHKVELEAAQRICSLYCVEHRIISLDPRSFAGSSLVDRDLKVPSGRSEEQILTTGIQNTYVPARNTLFLSYAMGYAEILGAQEIHVGFNKMDRGGYPDCRPDFVDAFQRVVNVATRQSVTAEAPIIMTPLFDLDKKEIIALGMSLKAPLELTHSCYSPSDEGCPCGECDACRLRQDAFRANSGVYPV